MKILFILILCVAGSVFGQMLDNTMGQVFEEKPFFNTEFIAKNRIRSIKGNYSTKATLDQIRPNSDIYVYDFDKEGRLIREYKTAFEDTIVVTYEYNEKNLLSLKRQSDQYGFHSYTFKYDEKGRIVEQEYRRDSNKNSDKMNFDLDESYIITTEKFSYLDYSDSTYKKVYYNNAGFEYKTEFYYHTWDGQLTKQEGKLRNGSGNSKVRYSYDAKGRISGKQEEVTLTKKNVSRWEYEYDEIGNLQAVKYYRNGSWITEYQIVYERQTLLLSAIITRDHATNFMMILQFKDVDFYY
ncbi:MAG: hypothetical protein MK078_02450 [Crocinitomicaceae bacterium]|nr:hypothetical protein [Crocinitomicaceae bacterium]